MDMEQRRTPTSSWVCPARWRRSRRRLSQAIPFRQGLVPMVYPRGFMRMECCMRRKRNDLSELQWSFEEGFLPVLHSKWQAGSISVSSSLFTDGDVETSDYQGLT